MKLWGGDSDTGCCSVADVDDARRVAQQLGIDHLVFNFTDDFDAHVVEPYVARPRRRAHAEPVHRVQPPPQVRPARRAGRPARLRRRRHRPPRPRRTRRRRPLRRTAAPTRPRTRATSCTCSTRRELRPHAVPGRATAPRPRCATAPPRSACAPPTSPTARTCASSPRPAAAQTFLGDAHPVPPRARRRHGRRPCRRGRRRSSWSRSASAAASACPAAGRSGTSSTSTGAAATVVVGDEADLLRRRARRRRRGVGRPARTPARCSCSAAPTAPPCPADAGRRTSCAGSTRSAGSRPARASCSTTRTDRYVLGGGIAR